MATSTSHTPTTPTELEYALREIDRLIHRSQEILHRARPVQGVSSTVRAWQAAAGLWKGKLTEDPLAYQQRVRSEEEV